MKKMFSLFSMILLFVSLTQAQSLSLTASPSTVENGADITFTVSGEVGITYYVSSVYTNYIESATSGMLINPATGMTTYRPTKFKCQALFASAGSTSPKQVTFVFDVKVYSQAANGYIDAKLSASVMVNPPPVQTVFNSVAKSITLNKNNCGDGFSGTAVTYNVPAGKYQASTQAAADAKADNDIAINGQNYANTNGTCTPNPPFVSGSATMCDNGIYTYTYTINNLPPGVTLTSWTASFAFEILGSNTDNSVNIHYNAAANSTKGILVAHLSDGSTARFSIFRFQKCID